ncbi:MAG: ABC transporter permease, partial [Clostridiales bacterium]|nr:ABC transporter permease [Clostridiales bacterium]
MVKTVWQKILNNKWLFICLVLGSLLITAILTSIPIYSDGSTRKMLVNELLAKQQEKGVDPGQTYITMLFPEGYSDSYVYHLILSNRDIFIGKMAKSDVKITEGYERYTIDDLKQTDSVQDKSAAAYKLECMTNCEKHMDIVEGRMYSDQMDGDAVEIIVNVDTFNNRNMSLGQEFEMTTTTAKKNIIKAKVVGVYEPKDVYYWNGITTLYNDSMLMSSNLFVSNYLNINTASIVSSSGYLFSMDFYSATITDMYSFVKQYNSIGTYLNTFPGYTFGMNSQVVSVIMEFYNKSTSLRNTMWILNAPVLVMLALYIFMVAKLIITEDSNEISVLKSRGGHPFQIFLRYVIESGMIVFFALLLGPPLGLLIAQIIGSSNGFMEFVNRTKLYVGLGGTAYIYAIAAGIFFMITVLIPSYLATKDTIVQLKQKKVRKKQTPIWQKFYLDIIFLIISVGG